MPNRISKMGRRVSRSPLVSFTESEKCTSAFRRRKMGINVMYGKSAMLLKIIFSTACRFCYRPHTSIEQIRSYSLFSFCI